MKRKSSRYQAPLLNAPRLAQEHYCILSCTENSTAGAYTSSYRPAHCSYSSPLSTLCGQILGYVKEAILANSVFAKHVGMVTRRASGKGYESFASFLLTQEGHRKSYLTFITHLAQTCSQSKQGNKDGSPLEKKLPTAETLYLVNTEPWDSATWVYHLQIPLFKSGSVPSCPQAGWDGENSKRLWTFKIKILCEGEHFNTATQNTAGKKSSSYQCLLCGAEASCLDPASAAICHFSSPALFSVWSHLSRHSTLGQHSQAVGRTSKELSSELPTLLLEDFPPAQMCSDSPSAAGGTIEGLQLKQLLKDTAKCDWGAFCLLGCLAPCDGFVAPTQTWLRAAPRNTGDLLVCEKRRELDPASFANG